MWGTESEILIIFLYFLAASAAKNCEKEVVNQSAATAASPDYVKFQAVIKSAASAASLDGGRASSQLHRGFLSQFLAALAANNIAKKCLKN